MIISFTDQKDKSFHHILKTCEVAKSNLQRCGIETDVNVIKEENFVKLDFNCFSKHDSENEQSSLLFLTEISLLGLIDHEHLKKIILSLSKIEKRIELRNLRKIENSMNDFFDFHFNLNKFLLENSLPDSDAEEEFEYN